MTKKTYTQGQFSPELGGVVLFDNKTGRRLNRGESINIDVPSNSMNTPSGSFSGGTSESFTGRFEGLTSAEAQAREAVDMKAGAAAPTMSTQRQQGESNESLANRISNKPFDMAGQQGPSVTPTLSFGDSAKLKQEFGLTGTGFDFTGLDPATASRMAKTQRDQIQGQQSALTSGSFNAQTIAGLKKSLTDFSLRLDSGGFKNPLNTNDSNNQNKEIFVNNFASEISKNFTNLDSFNQAQKNPEFMNIMRKYLDNGGSLQTIAAKIPTEIKGIQPATDTASFIDNQNKLNQGLQVTEQIENPDGTITNIMSDGSSKTLAYTQNADGTLTGKEVDNQNIYNTLLPETKIAQDEMARQMGLSKQVQDLYFGTPERKGIAQQIIDNSEATKKILEKKETDAKASTTERATFQKEKNEADIAIAKATNEKNRIDSQNYMVGMLAKLGALNTSGTAPVAIASLNEKYQRNDAELSNKLSFANRLIDIELTEDLNKITNTTAENINSINEDLTKSEKDIAKEIFDVQNKSNREIYSLMKGSAEDLKKEKDKYEKSLKSNSKAWTTEFLQLVGKGFSKAQAESVLTPEGLVDINKLTPGLLNKFAPKPKATGGGSGGSFTPTESRTIARGGLANATQKIKEFFITRPNTFQDEWTANIDINQNPTYENITKSFRDWESNATDPSQKQLTRTQYSKGEQYLINNNAPEEYINSFKNNKAFQNQILSDMNNQ